MGCINTLYSMVRVNPDSYHVPSLKTDGLQVHRDHDIGVAGEPVIDYRLPFIRCAEHPLQVLRCHSQAGFIRALYQLMYHSM